MYVINCVIQVKWAQENYHHDLNSPYSLRLASADHNGLIVVWDVAQGTARSDFSDGNKPVHGACHSVSISLSLFLSFSLSLSL